MNPTITAIVITKNEAEMIVNCLETLRWCDEILVVDSGSSDTTIELAQHAGATVQSISTKSFAQLRTQALKSVTTDWVVYIDADERVLPQLAKEILVQIETNAAPALAFLRQNIMYGKSFSHGGWQNEWVTRVFRMADFKGWQGDIHESPVFSGEIIKLHTALLHFTHRNTSDNLQKTQAWTPIEARLLFEGHTPPVKFMTLLRKGGMEFFRRLILKKGYQDGMEGWIEALVQGINRVLVYIQLWELQQQPTLPDKYQQQEVEVVSAWKKTKLEDLSPLLRQKKTGEV